MALPVFEIGSTLVAEDRWHDLLWSAMPQRVISSTPTALVTYAPTGVTAARASNRGLPGTEKLTRDQRKLQALRTNQARVVEVDEAPDRLFFYRPDRWARVSLGWDHATGDFTSWYVNFELPATPTPIGIATMDLVIDIWINPDRTWEWKDRDDFQSVIDDRTLDPGIQDRINSEADQLLHELQSRTGPFADSWLEFRPDPEWPTPTLPESHAWRGHAWSFEIGPARKAAAR